MCTRTEIQAKWSQRGGAGRGDGTICLAYTGTEAIFYYSNNLQDIVSPSLCSIPS